MSVSPDLGLKQLPVVVDLALNRDHLYKQGQGHNQKEDQGQKEERKYQTRSQEWVLPESKSAMYLKDGEMLLKFVITLMIFNSNYYGVRVWIIIIIYVCLIVEVLWSRVYSVPKSHSCASTFT